MSNVARDHVSGLERPADVVTPLARRDLYRRARLWDGARLPERVAHFAFAQPEKVAVVDLEGKRCVTYGELTRDIERVAHFLVDAGVGSGDVVTVQMPNWYETVAIDLGVISVGAVLNPVLPVYRANELRAVIDVARSKAIFTPASYRDFDHAAMIESLRVDTPQLRMHVALPDPEVDPGSFDGWLSPVPATASAVEVPASSVSELIFTSGTEARPKAIMHTEETTSFAARAAGLALGLSTDDVVWMPSPIGHSTGFNYGVRVALHHGMTLVLQDRWSARAAAELVEGWRCTYTVAATTFLSDLVAHARSTRANLSSMKLFNCGGAPVPVELVTGAEDLGITVLRLYGSTEVLVATWNRPGSPREKRIATDGCPLDHVEIEVRDERGRAVVDAPGEIFTRGPSTSVGFFADPGRTAATFGEDGWVCSGDLGILDGDGYLTVVGRKKEIIIRGGLNIAPRELEDLILEHPAVAAVAVVGVPDPRLGEVVCACPVLHAGASLTLDEVVQHLRSCDVATFKLPQRLMVVPSLPMTPTGKIRKFELVEALLAESDRLAGEGATNASGTSSRGSAR